MKTYFPLTSTIGVACVIICLCNVSPFSPYQNFGSCDKPTIPTGFYPDSAIAPDSTRAFAVLEIYDYEKHLITMYTTEFLYQKPLPPFSIFWNGLDQYGNRVECGKYTAKVSIITPDDTTCNCKELYVAE
jgi:hypothetical protein